MKSTFSLEVLTVLCGYSLSAAPDPQLQLIKMEAEKVAKAFKEGDYARMVGLTHPSLVEKIGGKDKMIEVVKNAWAAMKDQGLAVVSYTVDAPKEVVAGGNDLFAVLPQIMILSAPGKKITVKSNLIGISNDKGKTWTFVDGSNINEEQVKQLIPTWPADLKLPAKNPPMVEKTE